MSIDQYVRRVFFGTLSLVLVFSGIFLLMGSKEWARGVALGGAASLVNLIIMAVDVRRQGFVAGGQGVLPAYGRYALRMSVIAAALIYSATNTGIALWATVPALFASQAVLVCEELLGGKERGRS